MNTCSSCRFWASVYIENGGECRRRAPIQNPGLGLIQWPITSGTDWCGDFEIKPELKPCVECGKPAGEPFRINPREHRLDIPGHVSRALMISPVCQECFDKLQEQFWRKDGDRLVPKV